MSEVPEHLLPYLHYQIDGTIIGDTPEAQAYVENTENTKMFVYFRAMLENKSKHISEYIDSLSQTPILERNFLIITIFFFNWGYLKDINILQTEKHLIELQNILVTKIKQVKLSNIEAILLDIFDACQKNNFKKDSSAFFLEKLPASHIIKDIKHNQIKSINIENYFCIENLNLPNLASNEVYFLGRNGDGKTLILQAIVFALRYAVIKHIGDKKEVGTLLQYLAKNASFSVEAKTIDNAILGSHVLADIDNVYAYGAHRHQYTHDIHIKEANFDTVGFLTLFDNNKKLLSPNKWLLDTLIKELNAWKEKKPIVITTEIAKTLLENLLNDEDNENTLTIEVDASKAEVRYKERNGSPIQFEQLSSGYQSVMVWVADLLARMSERQPHVTKLEDFEAIVLVDEVGLHLHPKWEYSIMKKLRTWFPKIQFIVTTHSPILLMGASEDAIIYKIDKVNGKTNLVGNIPQSEISQMMSNQIITSPLFGLDSMAPPNFETKNASNDDFIYSKIHEAIRTRLANQPTLDDDTILQWINDELNNLPPID
jgi:hypothetical protein